MKVIPPKIETILLFIVEIVLHAFNVTQVCLRDQLEKVLCFSQGHNTYDLQLVFGMLLDFLNTITTIHPVIDAYAFKLRMMTPCC